MATQNVTIEAPAEDEIELHYIGTATLFRPQPAGEHSYQITITNVMDTLNKSPEEVANASVRYPQEQTYQTQSGERFGITEIVIGDDTPHGRDKSNWRAVRTTSDPNQSPSYNVMIHKSVLEWLEIDSQNAENTRMDIWIQDEVIGFSKAATVDV